VRCSWILLASFLIACGPSVDEPVAQSSGDGSSGGASSGDAGTSTSAASGAAPTSATGEGSSAADETAANGEELPPEAAGGWLCTGFEDPIFLQLETSTGMSWDGIACGPDGSSNPPPEWSSCDDLGFGHANLTNTQAYWTFELDYGFIGEGVITIEMGVDYVPASDTLEGWLVAVDVDPAFIPETCMRYVER
jgi:hypothetical protein